MNLILFAIPFFFLLIGIEILVARLKGKKNYYRFNDSITNLNLGIGSELFNTASKVIILGVYFCIYNKIALVHQPITWWSFLLALIGFDFFFYWAHRWGHEVNFFWGAHVVHHQSEEYNLSVALRQSWIHNMIAFVIFLPIPVLGFDPKIFFLAGAVHTIYQFWIHTQLIKKLPKPVEFIFNTPSHHRVHHGVDLKYLDKNYAGVFIIWDRIFGTFKAEEEQPTYGITTPLNSWNTGWANTHYYAEMFEKARHMTSLKDKLRIIFARPGWLPDEMGGFQQPKAPDKINYKVYDAKTNRLKSFYVLIQFMLITTGLVEYLLHFDTISWFYKVVFFFILVLSTSICGGIFENRKWVIYAEYLRLLLVMLSLNTFYYYWYIDWFGIMLIGSAAGFIVSIAWFTIGLLSEYKNRLQLAPQK